MSSASWCRPNPACSAPPRISTTNSVRGGLEAMSATDPLPPLCVDLDGTLVRSDTLVDSLASGARNWRIWRALLSAFHSRAAMKRRVAELEPVDAASLPYNAELLDYMKAEKARGRRLVL